MTPDEALERLRASELFAPDFPTRSTAPTDGAATPEEQFELDEKRIEAIRATDHRLWVDLVRVLGAARYAPAVPLLVELWDECVVGSVRVAAGHALREIGTPEAHAALEAKLEDADWFSRHLAVLEVFERDPASAYDRLSPYFDPARVRAPGGASVPVSILQVFIPSQRMTAERQVVPEWHLPAARRWLEGDRRWLDLCASLRKDEVLGDWARPAIQWVDPALLNESLERVRRGERPVERRVRSAATGDLLTRYMRGEHEAVWRELRAPEAIDGAFREEALAVSRETMRRFAAAADQLAERLGALGWRALTGTLRHRPSRKDGPLMTNAERVTGAPLPPPLRAFWEVVGGVDFVWDYNRDESPPNLGFADVAEEEIDALAVGPATDLEWAIERWTEENERISDPELASPFFVDLAPDALTKANVSGGGPYGIELPFAGVEPRFGNEEWSAPFVEYLRDGIRWGGFPGLAQVLRREDIERAVRELTRGLEPF